MSRKYDNSRDVPTDTLVKRLDELSDAIAGGRDSQDREFTMRIPAECDRDADLVLAESSRRLGAADTELAAAKARIAELERDNENLRSVMIAAAEEIAEHWDAHCDEDGYGPANLIARLERGLPSDYGYKSGDFLRLQERSAKLEKALELIAESCDVGRHDGLPEEGPALCATESWLIAKDALVAYRKGSEE